jgi:hypothetical protein
MGQDLVEGVVSAFTTTSAGHVVGNIEETLDLCPLSKATGTRLVDAKETAARRRAAIRSIAVAADPPSAISAVHRANAALSRW